MSYRDGSAFLTKHFFQNAHLYLFSIPWDETFSNIARSPEVLLPFIFKAAISQQNMTRHSYIIGKDQYVIWKPSQEWILPESGLLMKGPEEFIPSMRPRMQDWQIEIYDQIQKPGFYMLQQQLEDLVTFAFNEDRVESNPEFNSESELKEKSGGRAEIINVSDATALGQVLKDTIDKNHIGGF